MADQVDTHVRMPRDLRDALQAAADRNGRSLNNQINAALREWLDSVHQTTPRKGG